MGERARIPLAARMAWAKLREGIRRALGREEGWPPVGWVCWGSLRRTRPVSRSFGFDRGQPIDRFFLEAFIEKHAKDIQGRVLEVGDRGYTMRFGGSRVVHSDVLHAVSGNPNATIVGRLDTGEGLEWGSYDCFILTQTLHCIYDIASAVRNVARLLRPEGVALVSLPGISQISRYDAERWGDYWRVTPAAATRLFELAFGRESVSVESYGNPMTAAAFLFGLVVKDVPRWALQRHDPDYPLLICLRAMKTRTA